MSVSGRFTLDTNILVHAVDRDGTEILSEDIQHGRRRSGVEIVNPFAADAEARMAGLLDR